MGKALSLILISIGAIGTFLFLSPVSLNPTDWMKPQPRSAGSIESRSPLDTFYRFRESTIGIIMSGMLVVALILGLLMLVVIYSKKDTSKETRESVIQDRQPGL